MIDTTLIDSLAHQVVTDTTIVIFKEINVATHDFSSWIQENWLNLSLVLFTFAMVVISYLMMRKTSRFNKDTLELSKKNQLESSKYNRETSEIIKKHNVLSLKPLIQFIIYIDNDLKKYKYEICNKGLASAIIKDFRLNFNGKDFNRFDELYKYLIDENYLIKTTETNSSRYFNVKQFVLKNGESIELFSLTFKEKVEFEIFLKEIETLKMEFSFYDLYGNLYRSIDDCINEIIKK